MSSFKNINFNSASLDYLFSYLTNSNCIHKPLISAEEQNIINSQDSSSKAQLLFVKIIDWQNELTKQRIAPDSQVIDTRESYAAFVASQNALNKLKRKFNKLFLENVTPPQTEEIAKQQLEKIDEPVSSDNIEFIEYIIKNFGYNDSCLQTFARWYGEGCELQNANEIPIEKLIELKGFPENEEPTTYTMLNLLDVLIKMPISGNTWGFPGQEPTVIYSQKVGNAANARLKETRDENKKKVKLLAQSQPMSNFKRFKTFAKLQIGQYIGNCTEGAIDLFNALTRDENYVFVALCQLKGKPIPGTNKKGKADHAFVIAQERREHQKNVLDHWNGASIHPESKNYKYLRDNTKQLDSRGRAITRKFNPNKQEIEVLAYNLYPYEAFKKDSKIKHTWLLELLERFHKNSDPQERTSEALHMISFIENKMPLYEYYDPALRELYDQLMDFTKKARKKGVNCTSEADIIPINEALKKLDKSRLKQYLAEKKPTDGYTILHALKASLLSGDMDYYDLASSACHYDTSTPLTESFDPDPKKAVAIIYKNLFPTYTALR